MFFLFENWKELKKKKNKGVGNSKRTQHDSLEFVENWVNLINKQISLSFLKQAYLYLGYLNKLVENRCLYTGHKV
jgi:hypothetical protein